MIISNDNPTGKFLEVSAEFPVQKVLELACAAQRTNKAYIKTAEYIHDDQGKFLYVKHDNKTLVRHALGVDKYNNAEQEFRPMQLFLEQQDAELAEEIRSYYKRLMFAAVKGDNEFQTEIFSLLMTEHMPSNKIGFIACLPSVYVRDVSKNKLEKLFRIADNAGLAEVGDMLLDRDCEILQVNRSKNFDAYNVLAVIDNKLVSWFNKSPIKDTEIFIRLAKVKGHNQHFITKKCETRLNYVKVEK
jgi:hypothetical protein